MPPFAELIATIAGDPAPLYRTLGQVRSSLPGLLALGGAGGGVSISLGFAAREAIKFEGSLAELAKVTGLGGTQLTDFRDELEALSVRMKTVPLDKLFAIATTGAKLGTATEDLLEFSEGMSQVATAMNEVPAEVVAEEIGKINIVMGLGVKGALQLGSAINKLGISGASSDADILDVTQRISGVAVATRLTAQETVALAAALLDTGTEAEAGAGALAQLLNALTNVGDQEGFARVLGISAEEFAAQVRDKPIGAIQDFLVALAKLDAGAQQSTLKSIGIEGVRGAGNIQKLAIQAAKLSGYVDIANEEFLTLNQITNSYNIQANLTQSSITKLWNQVEIAARVVGDKLTPAIVLATDTFGTIAAKVPELVSAFQDLAGTDWGQQIASSFTVNLPSATGIIDTVINTVRNFDLILQDSALGAADFGLSVAEVFSSFAGSIASGLDFGLQVIVGWTDQAYNKFVGFYNAVQPLLKNLVVPIADLAKVVGIGPGGGGVANPLSEVKVRVPEARDFGDLGVQAGREFLDQVRTGIRDQIAEREATRLARDEATKADAAPKVQPAGAQAGTGTIAAAEEKRKGTGETFGLEAFAKRLQEGALGKDDPARKTAEATQRTAAATQELVKEYRRVRPKSQELAAAAAATATAG